MDGDGRGRSPPCGSTSNIEHSRHRQRGQDDRQGELPPPFTASRSALPSPIAGSGLPPALLPCCPACPACLPLLLACPCPLPACALLPCLCPACLPLPRLLACLWAAPPRGGAPLAVSRVLSGGGGGLGWRDPLPCANLIPRILTFICCCLRTLVDALHELLDGLRGPMAYPLRVKPVRGGELWRVALRCSCAGQRSDTAFVSARFLAS